MQILMTASQDVKPIGVERLVRKAELLIEAFALPAFPDTMLRIAYPKLRVSAYGTLEQRYTDIKRMVEEMLNKQKTIDSDTFERIRLLMSYIDVLYAEFKDEKNNPRSSDIQLRRELKGMIEVTPVSFSAKQEMMRAVYKSELKLPPSDQSVLEAVKEKINE